MNNVEKGKLLATLFPEQLAGILDCIIGEYRHLTDNEDSLRAAWNKGLTGFDFWYRYAEKVHDSVNRHGIRLTKNSSLFAEELFEGYCADFTIECIQKHAAWTPYSKYRQAVALLFEP